MLSRIARGMYELGRRIESAENVTRILDVNHRMSLELDYFSDLDVWSPMLAITRSRELFDDLYDEVNEANVYDFLLFSDDNPNSVMVSLRLSREYARTMRERISEEMWEHLNEMHLEMQQTDLKQVFSKGSYHFNKHIQSFCNAFQGYADNTMVHGEAWQFLRLGRNLERAAMTSRILAIKYHMLLPESDEVGRPLDLHQWQALLRSVSGFEAYRRLYRARISPPQVVNLMLYDPRFPRSLCYCITQVQNGLRGIRTHTESQRLLYAQVASFREELEEGSGKRVLQEGLLHHVEYVEDYCSKIHQQLLTSYLDPMIILDAYGREVQMGIQAQQQQQVACHGE